MEHFPLSDRAKKILKFYKWFLGIFSACVFLFSIIFAHNNIDRIISFPIGIICFLVTFGGYYTVLPYSEVFLDDKVIQSKKAFWGTKEIPWEKVKKIIEFRQTNLLYKGDSGYFHLTIKGNGKRIFFSDHIKDYQRLRQIVLERSGVDRFVYKKRPLAEIWIKK